MFDCSYKDHKAYARRMGQNQSLTSESTANVHAMRLEVGLKKQ
jgi:hypothetical protein